jgi:transposase
MQFKTLLRAAVPRVECPEHGVKQVKFPRAKPRSRFTLLFERLAIDVLRSTQNFKSAQAILRTGWEQIWNNVLRAVRRGQLRKEQLPIRHLGIDEKSFVKGQS